MPRPDCFTIRNDTRNALVRTYILLLDTQNTNAHYSDVIVITMSSQITSLTIVYSIVYSGADQRKHQSSASLAFVRGIHSSPVNSPHKRPVTRKMFPVDDVILPKSNLTYLPPNAPSILFPTVSQPVDRIQRLKIAIVQSYFSVAMMLYLHVIFGVISHTCTDFTPAKFFDVLSNYMLNFLMNRVFIF